MNATPNPKVTPKIYEDEVNMKVAATILNLSDMRMRTLTREGKVPSAKKNDDGFWRFSRKQLEDFVKVRPDRKAGGLKDGRTKYTLRLNDDEAQMVNSALKGTSLELKKAYVYDKAASKAKKATVSVPAGPQPKGSNSNTQ
jgi:hypothetical protein